MIPTTLTEKPFNDRFPYELTTQLETRTKGKDRTERLPTIEALSDYLQVRTQAREWRTTS